MYGFHYSFAIELNDVDTSLPVTARLQYGSYEGSGWQDVEGSEITLNSTDTVWSSELFYNTLSLDLGDEMGMLRQMRIVCDYTMKDGTEGTLYSTDCDTLYSYKGSYHKGVSAEYKDGIVTAVYQLEKALVPDPSPEKLKANWVTLISNGVAWDVTANAVVSPADENGQITVTCKVNEEILQSVDNQIILALYYVDENGKIEWGSAAAADFVYHKAPTFTLELPYSTDSDRMAVWLNLSSVLNDLRGGTAKATLEYSGDDFVTDEQSWETYDGDDTDTWDFYLMHPLYASRYDPEIDDYVSVPLPPRLSARVHIEYTYPDGTTGSWDSEEIYLYGDDIIVPSEADPYTWDPETKTLTMDFVAADFITPETDLTLSLEGLHNDITYSYIEPQDLKYTTVIKEDGLTHFIFTCRLPDLESGDLSIYLDALIQEKENIIWNFEVCMYDIIF